LGFSPWRRKTVRLSRADWAWAVAAVWLATLAWGALGCASVPPGGEPVRVSAHVAAPVESPQDLPPDSAHTQLSTEDGDDALIASIQKGPYDPLEPVNRSFFALNRGIDFVLLDPVTTAYQYVVPTEGRRAVRRVFRNLASARTLVNDLLQLEFRDALVTTARFAINSTLGFGGLFDPAKNFGLARHESDFGETLARVGVGAGPYLVLPLLGPTTFRDSVGGAVDGLLLPQFWLLGPGSRLLLDSGDGLSLRDEHMEDLRHLRESSVDYYAALRSAYLLDREGEIRERLERRGSALPAANPPTDASPEPDVEPSQSPAPAKAGQEGEAAAPLPTPPDVGAQAAALLPRAQ